MDPGKFMLVPLGNHMGKCGYIGFSSALVAILIALIVGSTFSQSMYVYRDNGYNCCIERIGSSNTTTSKGLILDNISRTQEQDFFFTPVECASFQKPS